jgi:hypothetical protein
MPLGRLNGSPEDLDPYDTISKSENLNVHFRSLMIQLDDTVGQVHVPSMHFTPLLFQAGATLTESIACLRATIKYYLIRMQTLIVQC